MAADLWRTKHVPPNLVTHNGVFFWTKRYEADMIVINHDNKRESPYYCVFIDKIIHKCKHT